MTQKNSDSSVTEYEEDEDEEEDEEESNNVDWKRNRTRNNKNVSPPVHDSGDTFQTKITEQLDTLHAVQFVHESFFGLNLVPSEASGSLEIGPWPFFDKSKFDEKQVDDKSSVITLSELSSSSLSRTEKVSLPPITLNCANLLRHVFDRYDTNKDGILSREDLDTINEKCGFDILTQEMYDWILSLEDSRHCTVDCFYSYFSWLALSEPRSFRRVLPIFVVLLRISIVPFSHPIDNYQNHITRFVTNTNSAVMTYPTQVLCCGCTTHDECEQLVRRNKSYANRNVSLSWSSHTHTQVHLCTIQFEQKESSSKACIDDCVEIKGEQVITQSSTSFGFECIGVV